MITCPLTGNLNARVLELLRTSEIQCLDLAASMTDEEGLNLDARDILHGIRTLPTFGSGYLTWYGLAQCSRSRTASCF